ncbi:MAG: septal ring lytic transglycosylase RlpA family protein [Proteobacteria bacterium]|nr:septal ring lytic transglycosylase RlpA family protein [Pseudomonadota bacterium]
MIIVFVTSGCSIVSRSADKKKAFYTPKNWQEPIKITESMDVAGARPGSEPEQKTQQKIGKVKPLVAMEGQASWYGPGLEGKRTTNGEIYDQDKLTASHNILPMDTWLEVTNRENNKTVIVRINDRGPAREDRIIELSRSAASRLDLLEQGTATVSLKVMSFPKDYDPQIGPKSGKKFVVQVGVFSSEPRAQAFQKQLAAMYPSISFLTEQLQPEKYHVFAGPYNTKNRAKKVSSSLKNQGVDNFTRGYK